MTGIILHTMLLFRRGPRFPAFPGDTVEINVLEAQSKGLIRPHSRSCPDHRGQISFSALPTVRACRVQPHRDDTTARDSS